MLHDWEAGMQPQAKASTTDTITKQAFGKLLSKGLLRSKSYVSKETQSRG
jgi:hypothetical protein